MWRKMAENLRHCRPQPSCVDRDSAFVAGTHFAAWRHALELRWRPSYADWFDFHKNNVQKENISIFFSARLRAIWDNNKSWNCFWRNLVWWRWKLIVKSCELILIGDVFDFVLQLLRIIAKTSQSPQIQTFSYIPNLNRAMKKFEQF